MKGNLSCRMPDLYTNTHLYKDVGPAFSCRRQILIDTISNCDQCHEGKGARCVSKLEGALSEEGPLSCVLNNEELVKGGVEGWGQHADCGGCQGNRPQCKRALDVCEGLRKSLAGGGRT